MNGMCNKSSQFFFLWTRPNKLSTRYATLVYDPTQPRNAGENTRMFEELFETRVFSCCCCCWLDTIYRLSVVAREI